jgi:hypothetical protein
VNFDFKSASFDSKSASFDSKCVNFDSKSANFNSKSVNFNSIVVNFDSKTIDFIDSSHTSFACGKCTNKWFFDYLSFFTYYIECSPMPVYFFYHGLGMDLIRNPNF